MGAGMPEPSAKDHSARPALTGEWASQLASQAPIDEIEASVLAAPAPDSVAAVRALSDTDANVVPLLERLGLSSRRDLALAAAEALGGLRLGEAAAALDRLAAGASDK